MCGITHAEIDSRIINVNSDVIPLFPVTASFFFKLLLTFSIRVRLIRVGVK